VSSVFKAGTHIAANQTFQTTSRKLILSIYFCLLYLLLNSKHELLYSERGFKSFTGRVHIFRWHFMVRRNILP